MTDLLKVSLIEIAMAADDEARAALKAKKGKRLAGYASKMATQLADWTAMAVTPIPTTVPFKWQGFWFDTIHDDQEMVGAPIYVYAWDTDGGWRWRPVHSLASIGNCIRDIFEMAPEDRKVKAECEEYLPDLAGELIEEE